MAKEIEEIVELIEKLRQKLYKLEKAKGFGDPEVLAASRMFDVVLNEYHRLLKQKE